MLYDTTFEVIVGIMELIDGYSKSGLKMDAINRETSESLRNSIELHDVVVDFIKYAK